MRSDRTTSPPRLPNYCLSINLSSPAASTSRALNIQQEPASTCMGVHAGGLPPETTVPVRAGSRLGNTISASTPRYFCVIPQRCTLVQYLLAYHCAVHSYPKFTCGWVATTCGVQHPQCSGCTKNGDPYAVCEGLATHGPLLQLLAHGASPPKTMHLTRLGFGALADQCRTLAERLHERKKNSVSTLRRCASLDKQVALCKQIVTAIADLKRPRCVPRILDFGRAVVWLLSLTCRQVQ